MPFSLKIFKNIHLGWMSLSHRTIKKAPKAKRVKPLSKSGQVPFNHRGFMALEWWMILLSQGAISINNSLPSGHQEHAESPLYTADNTCGKQGMSIRHFLLPHSPVSLFLVKPCQLIHKHIIPPPRWSINLIYFIFAYFFYLPEYEIWLPSTKYANKHIHIQSRCRCSLQSPHGHSDHVSSCDVACRCRLELLLEARVMKWREHAACGVTYRNSGKPRWWYCTCLKMAVSKNK